MGPAPFHEHIFAFPIFFHVCSLWTVETPTRPCLACEFGVLAGPRQWLLWGPGRREPGPLRAGFPRPGDVLGRPSCWEVSPKPTGRVLVDNSLPSKGTWAPGTGKWHFARWLGSLRLPVTCTTMSAQQTQGCLFPDVVQCLGDFISICSVTGQVQVPGLSWTISSC